MEDVFDNTLLSESILDFLFSEPPELPDLPTSSPTLEHIIAARSSPSLQNLSEQQSSSYKHPRREEVQQLQPPTKKFAPPKTVEIARKNAVPKKTHADTA